MGQYIPIVPGDYPPVVTGEGAQAIQSATYIIREMFLAKCASLPFFQGWRFKRTRMMPVQVEQLPLLAIYLMPDELMTPDGGANQGDIKFIYDARIGFSAIVINNDDTKCEQTLDAAFWAIMNGLWSDQYLTSVWDTYNPHNHTTNIDRTLFESVEQGRRRHLYGATLANNETPVGEMQYEATVRHRGDLPPDIEDMLNHIHVQTGFLGADGTTDSVQQVIVQYDFTAENQPLGVKDGNDSDPNDAASAVDRREKAKGTGGQD